MTTTAPPAVRRTIAQALAARRDPVALVPFIPAGYPDLATTAACLPALEQAGASVIEVGIPFSDPIADGPVIQAAYTQALAGGLRLADVLAMVAAARKSVTVPLLAMVSYSIIFRRGLQQFAEMAKSSGFDGLIVPDLPPPEAATVCAVVRAAGLETVLLVAPTTEPRRRKEIAALCSGFVYYLSVSGITGERAALPADLAQNVLALKALTDRPICVGFGISQPQHVAQLAGVADGAIVGTALVKRMGAVAGRGPADVAQALADDCRRLLGDVR